MITDIRRVVTSFAGVSTSGTPLLFAPGTIVQLVTAADGLATILMLDQTNQVVVEVPEQAFERCTVRIEGVKSGSWEPASA